jgi:hypothetical protein
METLFQMYKGALIIHPNYQGEVCGFNETHFILAVETKDESKFFRRLKKDFFIAEEYRDLKYRYIFEDESTIIKQMKCQDQRNLQMQELKAS